MTSGEGGMIVLDNPEHARVCKLLRNQGMEKRYQNEVVGFNLRMTDIHAAIGSFPKAGISCENTKIQKNNDNRVKFFIFVVITI